MRRPSRRRWTGRHSWAGSARPAVASAAPENLEALRAPSGIRRWWADQTVGRPWVASMWRWGCRRNRWTNPRRPWPEQVHATGPRADPVRRSVHRFRPRPPSEILPRLPVNGAWLMGGQPARTPLGPQGAPASRGRQLPARAWGRGRHLVREPPQCLLAPCPYRLLSLEKPRLRPVADASSAGAHRPAGSNPAGQRRGLPDLFTPAPPGAAA